MFLLAIKWPHTKTGALIVLERNNSLDFLTTTGDEMNIRVTQPIIESIFFKNSPLHDGAIIVNNNIVKATRVIFLLIMKKSSHNVLGYVTELLLVLLKKQMPWHLVVSEETGHISYFKDGEFIVFKDTEELAQTD